MKTIKILSIMLLLLSLAACSKEKEDINTDNTDNSQNTENTNIDTTTHNPNNSSIKKEDITGLSNSAYWINLEGITLAEEEMDICAERTYPTTVSSAERDIIVSLFEKNGINYSNYHFEKLLQEESGLKTVHFCILAKNGLPVSTSGGVFCFNKNDICITRSGGRDSIETYSEATPKMKMEEVAILFKKCIKYDAYTYAKGIVNACFELGYSYKDLDGKNILTKIWEIKPKGQMYPVAYVDDATSQVIYYFNGLKDD